MSHRGCGCCAGCLIADLRPGGTWLEDWTGEIGESPYESSDTVFAGEGGIYTQAVSGGNWYVRLEVLDVGDMTSSFGEDCALGAYWSDGDISASIVLDATFDEFPRLLLDGQYRCVEYQPGSSGFELRFYRETGTDDDGDYVDHTVAAYTLTDPPVLIGSNCRRVHPDPVSASCVVHIESGTDNDIDIGEVEIQHNGAAVAGCPTSPCSAAGEICSGGAYHIITSFRWVVTGASDTVGLGTNVEGSAGSPPICDLDIDANVNTSEINGTYNWPLYKLVGASWVEQTAAQTAAILQNISLGPNCWDDGSQYAWIAPGYFAPTSALPQVSWAESYDRTYVSGTGSCWLDTSNSGMVDCWKGVRFSSGGGCGFGIVNRYVTTASPSNAFAFINLKQGCTVPSTNQLSTYVDAGAGTDPSAGNCELSITGGGDIDIRAHVTWVTR